MFGTRSGERDWLGGGHAHASPGIRAALRKILDAEIDRWFLWVPVCFGVGIGCYFSLSGEPSRLTAILLLVSALSLCLVSRSRPFIFAACIALFCAALGFADAMFRTSMVTAPRLEGSGRVVTINAWVERVERRHPRGYRLTLRPVPGGEDSHGMPWRVRVISRFEDAPQTGQLVALRAVLRPIPEPVLPHGFDFSRKAFYAGLGAIGFAISPPSVLPDVPGAPDSIRIRAGIDSIRRSIENRIASALPEKAAAIIVALVTGDRDRIPDETLQALRDSGLAHLLAISGMHMALMAGALYWLVRVSAAFFPRLALSYPIKKWAAVVALAGGAFYLIISGGSVATQRAFLMMAIIFCAILLDRPALTLRNVALSACIILAVFPESLLDVSFQMSFAAVTALIAVYERLERRQAYASQSIPARIMGATVTYVAGIALTTLVASIAIAPFAAYHFHKLAQFSLLANLAAMPFFGLMVMPAALLALMTMPFGLETYPLHVMAFGVENIIAIAQRVAGWEGATLAVATMPVTSLLALVFGGLWLTLWQTRWRLLGLPIALLGVVTAGAQPKPDLLIGREGKLLAVRTNSHKLAITGAKKPNYSLEQWLRADGDRRNPFEALKGQGFQCDELACVARSQGKSIAFVRHPAALAEECDKADIVIAQMPINRPCPNARINIDRLDLWRGGAHALYFDGQSIRVETVTSTRGNRPWSRTIAKRGKTAPDGKAYAGENDGRSR